MSKATENQIKTIKELAKRLNLTPKEELLNQITFSQASQQIDNLLKQVNKPTDKQIALFKDLEAKVQELMGHHPSTVLEYNTTPETKREYSASIDTLKNYYDANQPEIAMDDLFESAV